MQEAALKICTVRAVPLWKRAEIGEAVDRSSSDVDIADKHDCKAPGFEVAAFGC